MLVLNLDRVLLTNFFLCRIHHASASQLVFIGTTNLKLLFKNNTCFTFNTKFAISLYMIGILVLGFLKITPVHIRLDYVYSI